MSLATEVDLQRFAADCKTHGFAIRDHVLSDSAVDQLRNAIAALPPRDEVRRKRNVYGVRNLLEICPAVRALSADARVRRFAAAVLGDEAFAVRAIYFDKTPDANWSLWWHQDNVISVAERRDVEGYVGWSCKTGVWQVQPPAEVLANMLAIRVHLDDCGSENGPLRVIPGSHRHGWLDDQLDEWKQRVPQVVCTAAKGGIVAMCPLLLHASAPSSAPGHRRVIHIEYARDELPGGLEWNRRC